MNLVVHEIGCVMWPVSDTENNFKTIIQKWRFIFIL